MAENPHLTNRQVQIGNICIQWSSLEYTLACAIWHLSGIHDPEVGKIVTAHLDLKQRVSMVFALAHETNAPVPFKISVKKLQDSVRKEDLIHKRNQAVHGIHFPATDPAAVEIEMHRGKGGRAPRLQTDKELEALGYRVCELRNEFAIAFLEALERAEGEKLKAFQSFGQLLDIVRNSSATMSESDTNGPE